MGAVWQTSSDKTRTVPFGARESPKVIRAPVYRLGDCGYNARLCLATPLHKTRRVVSSKRSLHASLRNHFVDPSGSKASRFRPCWSALQGHDHRRRVGAPRGRWGRRQMAYQINKLAKAHYLCLEHRSRPGRDGRTGARLQVQRRRAAPPDGAKKKADTGPSSMMKTVEREEAQGQPGEFAATER